MDTQVLPPMTTWQFYAMFAVQFVLGMGFCAVMWEMGKRDPRLGWQKGPVMTWVHDKLFVIFIFLAGLASYELLPSVYHAFVNDVSTAVAESVVNSTEELIKGGSIESPDFHGIEESLRRVVWGQLNDQQYEAIVLMSGFWLFLGWFCYIGNYKGSPVGFLKRVLKVIGYASLSIFIIMIPKDIHYFSWDEFKMGFVLLVIGAVCIVASYSYNKLPPPLPMPEQQTPLDAEDYENDL